MSTNTIRQLLNVEHAIRLVQSLPAHKLDLSWWTMRGGASHTTGAFERNVLRYITALLLPFPAASSRAVLDAANAWVTACFGGLVAADPYFQAQGVRRGWFSGRPVMWVCEGGLWRSLNPRVISMRLFGEDLFYWSGLTNYMGERNYDAQGERDLLLRKLARQQDCLICRLTSKEARQWEAHKAAAKAGVKQQGIEITNAA